MAPFIVEAVVVGLLAGIIQPVQPEALNCSYHPGTDTVSCMSVRYIACDKSVKILSLKVLGFIIQGDPSGFGPGLGCLLF